MIKQTIKNIAKKIGEESLEFAKDSAKQVAKTVSPTEFVKQATGTQTNEFKDYLKNIYKENLTPDEMEKKKKEMQEKEEEEKKKLRIYIQSVPAHMRLREKPAAPRPYETTIQDEERKKAAQVEAQKKQQQPMSIPMGKQARGMLGSVGKKRPKSSDFEAGKNIKIG